MVLLGNQFNAQLNIGYQYTGTRAVLSFEHDGLTAQVPARCQDGLDKVQGTLLNDAQVMPLAFTNEAVEIPPLSRAFVKALVPAGVAEGTLVATSRINDPRFQIYGLCFQDTLIEVTDGCIVAEVFNPRPTPVTIGEMIPFCRFDLVSRPEPDYTPEEAEKEVRIWPGLYEGRESAVRLRLVRRLLQKHPQTLKRDLAKHYCHVGRAKIEIKPGETPHRASARRLRPADEVIHRDVALKLISQGLSYHGDSDWAANMVPVKKPDGSSRPCNDLRGLNLRTVVTAYPLPDAESNLSRAAGRWHTAADMLGGFQQCLLHPNSHRYTALNTPVGLLLSGRLPQGWAGSPGYFAKMGLRVFDGVSVEVFVDDLLNSNWTFEDHIEAVDAVWVRCDEGGLALKGKKVFLCWPQLRYLGFLVDEWGRRPDPDSIKPILAWTLDRLAEKPLERVRSWLGWMGVYQSFIPNFSMLTAPFWAAVTSASPREALGRLRTRVCFAMLRCMLATCVALARPDFSKRFYIMTDAASSVGGCAVLYQIVDDKPRPLAFWSTRFVDPESGYCSRDLECYVVWCATRKWRWACRYGALTIYTGCTENYLN